MAQYEGKNKGRALAGSQYNIGLNTRNIISASNSRATAAIQPDVSILEWVEKKLNPLHRDDANVVWSPSVMCRHCQ